MSAGSKIIIVDKYHLTHNVTGVRTLNYILLYADESHVGQISFLPKDEALPASRVSAAPNSYFYLYCYIDRYQEIIETLRYEKPIRVSVYWDDEDHVTSSNLSTYSGEPVGEQEGLGVPT
jgi:hypothetical protein